MKCENRYSNLIPNNKVGQISFFLRGPIQNMSWMFPKVKQHLPVAMPYPHNKF